MFKATREDHYYFPADLNISILPHTKCDPNSHMLLLLLNKKQNKTKQLTTILLSNPMIFISAKDGTCYAT